MYLLVEKYILQFYVKKIIRYNYSGEYLFFKIISFILTVTAFIILALSAYHINDIYFQLYKKKFDLHSLNCILSNIYLIHIFLLLIILKTDSCEYCPFYRVPVNKRRLEVILLVKKIYLNKFSIMLIALLIILVLNNNVFNTFSVLKRISWAVSNIIIIYTINVIAFFIKKTFITKFTVCTLLTIIFSIGLLSMIVASDLFINLLNRITDFKYIPCLLILLCIIYLLMIHLFRIQTK